MRVVSWTVVAAGCAWLSVSLGQEAEPTRPDVSPVPAAGSSEPQATGAPSGESPARGVASAPGGERIPPPRAISYPGMLTLRVDFTDLERRIFKVAETIPVKPGPLTLLYPEWQPGLHAPRGPIDALAGLVVSANGRRLEWQRDELDVFAFHVEVPQGVSRLELSFQFDSAFLREQGRTVVTPDLAGLQWDTVVLYPAGYFASRIAVAPSMVVPSGWQFASSLDVEDKSGGVVRFKPTTLETLVDSPVFAGRYFRSVDLAPNARVPVRLDLVADEPLDLEARGQQLLAHRRLLQEAYALLGPPPFAHYDFLFALSEDFGEIGLEHLSSSENRRAPGYFTDWERAGAGRDLLPHELAHAWNGKWRRPTGLTTPNFNMPMRDSLLWVYEGLTNYMQTVLAARSGLWSDEFTREAWASVAANMDRNRPGRQWRNLEDTTQQPLLNPRRPLPWMSWERTEDYYTEGELIWLDVDTRIRELTHDRRSLDDFTRAFFGGADRTDRTDRTDRAGAVAGAGADADVERVIAANARFAPLTYTLTDVVAALDAVAPFDWKRFFAARLEGHGPGAPLDGLTRGGWRLVYAELPSDYVRSLEEQRKVLDVVYSIGFAVSLQTAQLTEVRWGSPAFDAGLTLGTFLVAVNGREYRQDRLLGAIIEARSGKQPIELLVRNGDRYRTVQIAYSDGLQYPQLVRLEHTEDRLGQILKPRT